MISDPQTMSAVGGILAVLLGGGTFWMRRNIIKSSEKVESLYKDMHELDKRLSILENELGNFEKILNEIKSDIKDVKNLVSK